MRLRNFILTAAVALLSISGSWGEASGAEQVVREFDVVIRYTAELKGNRAAVRGTLQNVRFARMEEIELTVTALDEGGKAIGEQRELLIPVSLPLDEAAAFAVEMPLKKEGRPVGIRFLYRYRPNEGERNEPLEMRSINGPFDAPTVPSAPR